MSSSTTTTTHKQQPNWQHPFLLQRVLSFSSTSINKLVTFGTVTSSFRETIEFYGVPIIQMLLYDQQKQQKQKEASFASSDPSSNLFFFFSFSLVDVWRNISRLLIKVCSESVEDTSQDTVSFSKTNSSGFGSSSTTTLGTYTSYFKSTKSISTNNDNTNDISSGKNNKKLLLMWLIEQILIASASVEIDQEVSSSSISTTLYDKLILDPYISPSDDESGSKNAVETCCIEDNLEMLQVLLYPYNKIINDRFGDDEDNEKENEIHNSND